MLEHGAANAVDSLLEDPEVDQDVTRRLGALTGLYVPLLARERPIGVLVAHDKIGSDPRFTSADLRLAEQFANRAAIAVDLSRRVARDALRRVVSGQEVERRRLARELHDETGQALTSILLGLRAVEEAGPDEMTRRRQRPTRARRGTLQDVRRLAVQLRPKALDDFGLVPQSSRLVQTFSEATAIRVELEARLGTTAPGRGWRRRCIASCRRPDEHRQTRRSNQSEHPARSRERGGDGGDRGRRRGFDPAAARRRLDLVGMRERAELHDGPADGRVDPRFGDDPRRRGAPVIIGRARRRPRGGPLGAPAAARRARTTSRSSGRRATRRTRSSECGR